MKFFATLLILTLLLGFCEARRATNGYATSFVFLTARNTDTGDEVQVCANYLQYKFRRIAPDEESAKPVGLSFWRNRYNQTRICPRPSGKEELLRYNGTAVPINYRIDYDGTNCTLPFKDAFRDASQYEVDQLKKYNAENAILLVDKGRQFVARWHDYLFSDFHDPYINATEAIPTFFLYTHVFQEEILGLAKDKNISQLQLRFHRPLEGLIDLSMVIIWLLAVGCVLGGGVWAFFRHRAGKDKLHVNASSSAGYTSQSDSNSSFESRCRCLARHSNFLAIIVLMIIVVGVLMIGFFFRPVLVTFFNVTLVLFGSISVYACIMAVLSNISFWECCTAKRCTWIPQHRCIPEGRPSFIQLMVFTLSFGICVVWFVYRRTPYAFILLDFINVTLCLHILKSLRLPSVKWISALMLCMFIYDAVMVFVTPFITRNGCSVMLEVATGIDCSSSGTDGYPMPPIDAALPEKFPMLMQVPHFDPMAACIDLEIEKGFQMTILGLGDIIIPGYLVTHCFTMNGFSERVRISYGILCSIGYGLGLIMTFCALAIMNMAQPALIYLVPCTLFPICIMAWMKGQFRLLWNGAEDLTDSTASLKPNTDDDTGPQNDVINNEESSSTRQV
uniref:Signal peptide peptidase domain containing protein n=1 Tax=Haemonchus contortus TaxID=6289 RepID=A0A7I4XZ33_HAECO